MQTASSFQPSKNYVLVQPQKSGTTTKGGILLPDTLHSPISIGLVISTGDAAYKTGSNLFYRGAAASKIVIHGEEYVLVHVENVFGSMDADLPAIKLVG